MNTKFLIFQTATLLLLSHSGTCLEAVLAGRLPDNIYGSHVFYDGFDSAYLFGGVVSNYVTDSIQRYNLTSGKTEEVGKLPSDLYFGAITNDGNGNPIIIGGKNAYGSTATVLRYNQANETFTEFRDLLEPLSFISATSDGLEDIYVFGGIGASGRYRSNIVKYDIQQKLPSTIVAQLPQGLYATTAAVFGKSIYVFGGRNDAFEDTRDVTKFAPKDANKVEVLRDVFQLGFAGATAVKAGDFIYIVAGTFFLEKTKVPLSRFDPITNTAIQFNVINFPNQLYLPSVFYAQNLNRIYVIGGLDGDGYYTDKIYYIQLE